MCNEGQPWGKYRLIRNITGLWLVEECARYWKQKGMDIQIPELARQAQKEVRHSIHDLHGRAGFCQAGDSAGEGLLPKKEGRDAR